MQKKCFIICHKLAQIAANVDELHHLKERRFGGKISLKFNRMEQFCDELKKSWKATLGERSEESKNDLRPRATLEPVTVERMQVGNFCSIIVTWVIWQKSWWYNKRDESQCLWVDIFFHSPFHHQRTFLTMREMLFSNRLATMFKPLQKHAQTPSTLRVFSSKMPRAIWLGFS